MSAFFLPWSPFGEFPDQAGRALHQELPAQGQWHLAGWLREVSRVGGLAGPCGGLGSCSVNRRGLGRTVLLNSLLVSFCLS